MCGLPAERSGERRGVLELQHDDHTQMDDANHQRLFSRLASILMSHLHTLRWTQIPVQGLGPVPKMATV